MAPQPVVLVARRFPYAHAEQLCRLPRQLAGHENVVGVDGGVPLRAGVVRRAPLRAKQRRVEVFPIVLECELLRGRRERPQGGVLLELEREDVLAGEVKLIVARRIRVRGEPLEALETRCADQRVAPGTVPP